MGYFLDQECKYPEWVPPHMYEIYDVVYSIDVKYVPEIWMDIWQSPQDTERKGGDCEDWAIVIGKKLIDLGYTIEPVSCKTNTWGRSNLHMWIRVYVGVACSTRDAWDIDMIAEPRIFPAKLPHNLKKEEVDKFWNIVLRGK